MKFNKFALIFLLATIFLLIITIVGTCVSSDNTSSGIDSIHIESTAIFKTKEAVKKLLKSPTTANFASENQKIWLLPDSSVIVKGTVDAENSYGVMIRNNYFVKFKWNIDQNNNEIWELIDVNLE